MIGMESLVIDTGYSWKVTWFHAMVLHRRSFPRSV